MAYFFELFRRMWLIFWNYIATAMENNKQVSATSRCWGSRALKRFASCATRGEQKTAPFVSLLCHSSPFALLLLVGRNDTSSTVSTQHSVISIACFNTSLLTADSYWIEMSESWFSKTWRCMKVSSCDLSKADKKNWKDYVNRWAI